MRRAPERKEKVTCRATFTIVADDTAGQSVFAGCKG
jgi:hypothetical protein